MILKKIVDYVTQTPHNANPQVLKTLLETETSPNTGIVTIPIRGPLKPNDKISDYVPAKDAELAAWVIGLKDDDTSDLEGTNCELIKLENESKISIIIKLYNQPTFSIIPVDIPEPDIARGIYFINNDSMNVDDSLICFLMLMDMKKALDT